MLKGIKYFIQQSWLLIVAAFFFGLLLAITNTAWKPKIEQNKIDKFQKQVASVIKGAVIEKPIDGDFVINEKLSTEVYEVKDASSKKVGFAFQAKGPGYDIIELVIVVDAKCENYLGYGVLVCNETPGFGDKMKNDYYKDQFKNIPAEQLKLLTNGEPKVKDENIIAISGATISSQGVVDIFNNYIDKIRKQLIKRGLVD